MDNWKVWLRRLAAVAAVVCGVLGLIVGFTEGNTWKLGLNGWLTGGGLAALLSIVMYLDDASDARNR